MVSILDITPSTTRGVAVTVRGQDVEVRGISLGDIAYLIQNFPEVRDLFSGKDVQFDIDSLLTRAPEVVYGIIACGTGVRGNEQGTATIKALTLEEQTDLLDAILRETFKGGLGPFVAKVKGMLGLASDLGSTVSASNGRKQPKP